MKEQAGNLLKSIQQFWKAQEKKRKIVIISVFAGIVVVAVVLAIILNRPNYAVLFSSLEKSEAQEITAVLQDMQVEAQVKSDGTILVPKDQEDKLRMELATKGYPKSGYSYDIWEENVNMFTTDSQKKEIAKMQLQQRLQATIGELSGIEKAIVNLDIPQSSNTVISTSNNEASASVVVHLKPGTQLTSNQINGITHVVEKAVSGLKEENISVVDQDANLLVAGDNNADTLVIETQRLQFKKTFEAQLSNEVRKLLTTAYGENGINVTVYAEFDYDKKVTEDTKYTPSVGDSGMLEHEDLSSAWGNDGTTGGVPGVESNADGTYPTEDSSASGAAWGESSSSKNYLINTLKQQTEKNGVYVEKVAASVVLYKDALEDTEREKVINTVANAIGTKPENVSVENYPLLGGDPTELPTIKTNEIFGFSTQEIIIILIIAVVVLLIAIIVVNILFRKSAKKKKKLAAAAAAAAMEEHQKAIEIKKLSDKPVETKEAVIRREIGEFAKTSPDIAAQLLKTWIREEGE